MKIKSAFLCILCLLMCGCSVGIPVENLLTPPKLTTEQNEIYQTLINSVGTGIKLKYPRSGDFRSAFIIQNIDNESGDEALVFYENQTVQSGEGSLRLKILDKSGDRWQSVYDLACVGSEVDSVSFADLGSGNNIDIIVRYSMLNQTEKAFSVLNYRDGVPVELYASSYACLEVIDLNSDGRNELVTVVNDKVNQVSTAMMFSNGENGFEKLSEVPLSGSAADFLSVTKGMINENTMALFFDFSRGSGQSGTDVIYCYGNRVVSPNSVGEAPASSQITRFTNDYMAEIFSFDIDNDGLIEVPSTTPLPGYETLTRPEQLCAVQWHTVQDDNFIPEHYTYYSSKYRFALIFPNRWCGVVSAVVNHADNEIIFISYNPTIGLEVNNTTELMRIRAVDKQDTAGIAAAREMIYLGESEETVYYCSETAGYKTGKLALTESELKNCFIIL